MIRFTAIAALALISLGALGAEKKKPAPPPEVPLPTVDQLPLPPAPQEKPKAEGLQPPPVPLHIGYGVAGDLDPSAASRLAASLRSIAALAPLATEPVALAADSCKDDACLSALGAAQKLDRVVVARISGGALSVRALEVSGAKPPAEARQPAPADPAALRATDEALACKLLVPAGCTGEAHIDAPGATIEVDGKPAAPRLTLPVGVHAVVVQSGGSVARRSLPVVHDKPVALSLRTRGAQPALLTPDEVAQQAVVSAEPPAPPSRGWTRTAGYVALGVGIAAAGIAVAEGLHSKSQIDQAESGYRANGNVYRPADLSTLQSGNSAAQTANVLFAASGVLLASGLLLSFVF